MTSPAPNTSPSGEHGCKALDYDTMSVGGSFHRELTPTYCPGQVQSKDKRSLETVGDSPHSKPSLGHSPEQLSPRKFMHIFHLQNNKAKNRQPRSRNSSVVTQKEKLKLSQVSYGMASLQQSLHHYKGVTAWSPSRLEHRADGKATATSLSPEGHCGVGSMLCWGSGQHFSPVLSSGFSSSFSVQNSHLDFHVQQKARGDSWFWFAFPQIGVP